MARPATGSPRWNPKENRWEARITIPGQGRKAVPMVDKDGRALVPPCTINPTAPSSKCACESCAKSRRVAKLISDKKRNAGLVPEDAGDTVSDWFARYYKAAATGEVGRKNRGRPQASVNDRRARFRTWVEPVIGTFTMRAVTSGDLRRVVQKLDEAVRVRLTFYDRGGDDEREGRKPGLSPKSAQNIWSEVTNGFKEAVRSKLDDLRVLTTNPALDVQPPTTGEDREQAALFPSEVIALLSAEAIPVSRRRVYAVAIYTGMRRSELARLDAAGVDFEHDVIRVQGKKTAAAKRTIPIEATLRPLLEALAKERKTGPLVDVPRADGKGGASDLVKKDLERAEILRPDLSRDDAEHMPFNFHGLRHTCITHWTVAGRDQLFLLTAGGHTDVTMTKRYLAAASSLSKKFGTPHPPIPDVLLKPPAPPEGAGGFRSGSGVSARQTRRSARNSRNVLRPQRELNPCYRRERPVS
jgi:integrase